LDTPLDTNACGVPRHSACPRSPAGRCQSRGRACLSGGGVLDCHAWAASRAGDARLVVDPSDPTTLDSTNSGRRSPTTATRDTSSSASTSCRAFMRERLGSPAISPGPAALLHFAGRHDVVIWPLTSVAPAHCSAGGHAWRWIVSASRAGNHRGPVTSVDWTAAGPRDGASRPAVCCSMQPSERGCRRLPVAVGGVVRVAAA
jgi:hypothetical protein